MQYLRGVILTGLAEAADPGLHAETGEPRGREAGAAVQTRVRGARARCPQGENTHTFSTYEVCMVIVFESAKQLVWWIWPHKLVWWT